MAEKTFITQFEVGKTASTNLLPSTAFPSIVNVHGYVFAVFIATDDRAKVGRYENGVFTDYYLDNNPDWTVPNDGHFLPCLGVDRDGYIHVTVQMHNYPNVTSDVQLPDRYKSNLCMYFKSNSPYDPSSFTYYGEDATYCIPGQGFTDLRFTTDNYGVLYTYCRTEVHSSYRRGQNGILLAVYDETTKLWTRKGSIPPPYRNQYGSFTPIHPVIFWVDGGVSTYEAYTGYYNKIFWDSQNRMHFATEFSYNSPIYFNTVAYMMSDDGGDTWKKADGTVISSPAGITIPWESTLSYNIGNIVEYGGTHWRSKEAANLNHIPSEGVWWTSNPMVSVEILEASGIEIENQSSWVSVDVNDRPYVTWLDIQNGNRGVFRYWNGTAWTATANHVMVYDNNSYIYPNKGKQILIRPFSWGTPVKTTDTLTDEDNLFTLSEQVVAIDERHLIETEGFYGVATNGATCKYGYFYIGTPAPLAYAGPRQTTLLNQCTLNGSRSYHQDPANSIVSYLWEQVSGVTATITNPSNATTTVTGLSEGMSVFSLTVTDEGSITDTDNITIIVSSMEMKINKKMLLYH